MTTAQAPVLVDQVPINKSTEVTSPTKEFEPTPSPEVTKLPTTKPNISGQITLMAVGDIMLGRTIGEQILRDGAEIPFSYTANTLQKADIALGNLECAISERGVPEDKTYTFRAPLLAAESLTGAGFDLLTLANNHVMDFGETAFMDTLSVLDAQQIAVVGAGENSQNARRPIILERNGLRVAFLAYLDIPIWNYDYLDWVASANQPGVAWGYLADIETDVKAANELADVVVVLMHFGIEGDTEPSYQQAVSAHAAIDAGAKLVIGAHTHVLQEIERYNGGVIVYNLGNFVFDEFSGTENKSAIFMAHLTSKGVTSYKLIPVKLQENGIPIISR